MTIEKAVRAWPGWKLVRLGGHLYEHHRLVWRLLGAPYDFHRD